MIFLIGIYKITNHINGKIYIGQSIRTQERWTEHKNRPRSAIGEAIKKYGFENFTFEILEECEEEKLDEREKYWINYYDSYKNGYNLTLGGNSGYKYSVEDIMKVYKETNNIQTTAKIIGCHYNTVRRIVHENGINHSEQQLEIAVEQIDPKTLQVVACYDSIQDAADAVQANRSGISLAISGTYNTCAGYYWRKKGDTSKKFKPIKQIIIQQYDLNNNLIAEYNGPTEAAKALGKETKSAVSFIAAASKGKKTTAYGYIWKRIE